MDRAPCDTINRGRPRLLPKRALPSYAYVPGRFPHPIRHPQGHSFGIEAVLPVGAPLRSELFKWGIDLFDNGFYWEAHEAWEPLWRAAQADDPVRILLKALILLAAAGVKLREGKLSGMKRHALRAGRLLSSLALHASGLNDEIGIPLKVLSSQAYSAAKLGLQSSFYERLVLYRLAGHR